jgi:hypothetical protein
VEEMREITSYLWAGQFFEDAGDAAAGSRVFTAKRCATCHEDAASGAPKLAGKTFSGVWSGNSNVSFAVKCRVDQRPRTKLRTGRIQRIVLLSE